MIKNYWLKLSISSALSGIVMALAGYELVCMDSKNLFILGGFVQGFGTLIILFFNLYFFNCHLCDAFVKESRTKLIISILFGLIINSAFVVATSYLLRLTSTDAIINSAIKFTNYRTISVGSITGKEWYKALLTGLFCGVLVYAGVYIYKRVNNAFIKVLTICLAVGIFVVCGFENYATNLSYISVANMWNLGTFLDVIIVLIGNIFGAYLTYFAISFATKKNNNN